MPARPDLPPRMRRRLLVALVAGCAPVMLVACGGEDLGEVGPETPQEGTPREAPLAGRSPGARRLTVTVTENAGGFRYRAPRSVPAGLVEIRLRNDGAVPHKAQLWRITGDHTVREARARRPLPDWLRSAGGVALTAPAETGTTVQVLAPGRYYVAGTGGERGVVAELRATGTATGARLPRATARIDASEFSFRTSGLRPGRQAIDFRNTGSEPHHAYFARMRTGASIADTLKFFSGQSSVGRPPVDPEEIRETVVLEGRQRQVTELDLPAGRYALLCFVRNRAGGPQHTELGMADEVTIG